MTPPLGTSLGARKEELVFRRVMEVILGHCFMLLDVNLQMRSGFEIEGNERRTKKAEKEKEAAP
jgi:hypothetical protein